jgi:hypothetical protein
MEANMAQLGVLSKNRSVKIEENDKIFQSQYFPNFTVVLCPKPCV